MRSVDFMYDGEKLSDYGFMIVDFSSQSGAASATPGSEITFNTVKISDGKWYALTSTSYETCYETSFDIGKLGICNAESQDDMVITITEARKIMRWLNRKTFLDFKLLDAEEDTDKYSGYDLWSKYHLEGSFNLTRIERNGLLIGFTLNLKTNRPFMLMDAITVSTVCDGSDEYPMTFLVVDESDEIGYVYPEEFKVTLTEGGTLKITNSAEDRVTQVKNCLSGETITFDCIHHIISTDSVSHSTLANDFNYVFPRISNEYDDPNNEITMSLKCSVSLTYEPIAKVVF